jgi:hypothetical protein
MDLVEKHKYSLLRRSGLSADFPPGSQYALSDDTQPVSKKTSVIITPNKGFDGRFYFLGDLVITAAILDRLLALN